MGDMSDDLGDEPERYVALVKCRGNPEGHALWLAAYANNPTRDPGPIFAFVAWLENNNFPVYAELTRTHAEGYRMSRIPEAT